MGNGENKGKWKGIFIEPLRNDFYSWSLSVTPSPAGQAIITL